MPVIRTPLPERVAPEVLFESSDLIQRSGGDEHYGQPTDRPALHRYSFDVDFLADVKDHWELWNEDYEELALEVLLPMYHCAFTLRTPFGDLAALSAIAFSWMKDPPSGIVVYAPALGASVIRDCRTPLASVLEARFGKPKVSRNAIFGPKDDPFVLETEVRAAFKGARAEFSDDVRRLSWRGYQRSVRMALEKIRSRDAERVRDDPSGSLVRLCNLFRMGNDPVGLNACGQMMYLAASHQPRVH